MKDAPKVNAEEFHSTKANMSLLKELLKDREIGYEVEKGTDNKTQEAQSKEEKSTPSPFSKVKNPSPNKGK